MSAYKAQTRCKHAARVSCCTRSHRRAWSRSCSLHTHSHSHSFRCAAALARTLTRAFVHSRTLSVAARAHTQARIYAHKREHAYTRAHRRSHLHPYLSVVGRGARAPSHTHIYTFFTYACSRPRLSPRHAHSNECLFRTHLCVHARHTCARPSKCP